MLDDFGDASDIGGDYRDFAGHGFEGGQAEGLELRGKQEEIGGGEVLIAGVLLADEKDVFLQFLFADEIFRGATVGAITDENELGRHFGAHQRKDFDTIGYALDGTEVREVHEDRLVVGGPLSAQLFGIDESREIALHEVGDNVDGALDVEFLERLGQQVLGNGGHTVALRGGKASYWEIA